MYLYFVFNFVYYIKHCVYFFAVLLSPFESNDGRHCVLSLLLDESSTLVRRRTDRISRSLVCLGFLWIQREKERENERSCDDGRPSYVLSITSQYTDRSLDLARRWLIIPPRTLNHYWGESHREHRGHRSPSRPEFAISLFHRGTLWPHPRPNLDIIFLDFNEKTNGIAS